MQGPEPQHFTLVAEDDAGRVDRYLATCDLPVSRTQIQRLIAARQVTVNGKPVRASHILRGGEQIHIDVPPPVAATAAPEALPLELIYEDAWLAVIMKPRGLVVHPAPGHPSGTLVNALLHHCRDLSGVGGVLRPGIVHRLDKDTSGLLVVAKDDTSHRALQLQFRGRSVRKEYLAVVLGRLAGQGSVERPIGRHPVARKKMAVDVPRARAALTHWRELQKLHGATLLAVRIETGRTHQIRVHMASLGHPLVGDPLYGGSKQAKGIGDPAARRRLQQETTQALHAWRLGFRHPVSGQELSFTAPPPDELAALVQELGGDPTNLGGE